MVMLYIPVQNKKLVVIIIEIKITENLWIFMRNLKYSLFTELILSFDVSFVE